jgi:predicted phosphate transport protein (TIGR00153 family)
VLCPHLAGGDYGRATRITWPATNEGGAYMPLFDFLKSNDGDFFDWFEEAASITHQAAQGLRDLCYDYQNPQEAVTRLHDFEHKGDAIGHLIYNQLNNSFVTPLDREDIISLYSSIDDITDLVHSAADLMVTYKVETIPLIAQQLADCIVASTEEINKALPHLRKRGELKQINDSVIIIHSLENKADELLRQGLRELFDQPENILQIIKWRDIYDEMEQATDNAEDVADVLRGLVIKHA